VIAVVQDGVLEVLEVAGASLLPSVVGLGAGAQLLVGAPARNQRAAFPERAVTSVKWRMGQSEPVRLGDRSLMPPEVSALILRELCRGAERATGERVVFTVPAFFQDAQRAATRLAGEIAGLEVVRLINEPTAAALAFERTLLVHDPGGVADLDARVARELLEELIEPLVERSLDSAHEALTRSGRTLAQIDEVLLVGGRTRTPRIAEPLRTVTGLAPRRAVHLRDQRAGRARRATLRRAVRAADRFRHTAAGGALGDLLHGGRPAGGDRRADPPGREPGRAPQPPGRQVHGR
jgi:molecular chaperone DnaK (HSP70)